jgi:hypothetical protein
MLKGTDSADNYYDASVTERIEMVRRNRQAAYEAIKDFVAPLVDAALEVKTACPGENFQLALAVDRNARNFTLAGTLYVPGFHDPQSTEPTPYDLRFVVDGNGVPLVTVEVARMIDDWNGRGEQERIRQVLWSQNYTAGQPSSYRMEDLVELVREAATVYVTSKDEYPGSSFRI